MANQGAEFENSHQNGSELKLRFERRSFTGLNNTSLFLSIWKLRCLIISFLFEHSLILIDIRNCRPRVHGGGDLERKYPTRTPAIFSLHKSTFALVAQLLATEDDSAWFFCSLP